MKYEREAKCAQRTRSNFLTLRRHVQHSPKNGTKKWKRDHFFVTKIIFSIFWCRHWSASIDAEWWGRKRKGADCQLIGNNICAAESDVQKSRLKILQISILEVKDSSWPQKMMRRRRRRRRTWTDGFYDQENDTQPWLTLMLLLLFADKYELVPSQGHFFHSWRKSSLGKKWERLPRHRGTLMPPAQGSGAHCTLHSVCNTV